MSLKRKQNDSKKTGWLKNEIKKQNISHVKETMNFK